MSSRGKIIVYLAAVFLTGMVAGLALGFNLGRQASFRPPTRGKMAESVTAQMKAELGLSEEQTQKVYAINVETEQQLQRLHDSGMSQVEEIITQSHQRMSEFLTPDQREALRRFREAHQKKNHPKQPPPKDHRH